MKEKNPNLSCRRHEERLMIPQITTIHRSVAEAFQMYKFQERAQPLYF